MISQSSEKLNILVAYPYFNKKLMESLVKYKDDINLLVDSGAFTAHSKGKIITVDQYCEFLDSLPLKPWKYFMLDVIGNSEKTIKQYRDMLERGYSPIPIFTQGEKFETLDWFFQTSDLVGIGSLNQIKGNRKYVQYLMKQVKERKVHWLGFTLLDFMKKYKPFSCDSSSFTAGDRYGVCIIYLGKGKSLKNLTRKDFLQKPDQEILDRITQFGYDYRDCGKAEHWKNQKTVSSLTIASWVALSRDVKKYLGVNLFLAVSSENDFQKIMKQYLFQKENKL